MARDYGDPAGDMRLADLQPQHIVVAVCAACGRRGKIATQRLRDRHDPETRLDDLAALLKCDAYDNRHGNLIEVVTIRG